MKDIINKVQEFISSTKMRLVHFNRNYAESRPIYILLFALIAILGSYFQSEIPSAIIELSDIRWVNTLIWALPLGIEGLAKYTYARKIGATVQGLDGYGNLIHEILSLIVTPGFIWILYRSIVNLYIYQNQLIEVVPEWGLEVLITIGVLCGLAILSLTSRLYRLFDQMRRNYPSDFKPVKEG